ncbi:MAG TPA: glycosyltransferase family 2 protein [Chthoniobacteraceae bacterium]|nr:glycosyltransferase family 2 protein [Chthoniobacteraceae bacterium]
MNPSPSPAEPVELTVVMPCLNEAETLARCIEKAQLGFQRAQVRGEVLVADNGSTDGSREIGTRLGARVVPVTAKGYGSALRGGIEAASSEWIMMGDADDSYDFSDSEKFIAGLRAGNDLVMGCRMPRGGGTIMPGAMPWKNRHIGNPILSFLGRLFFRTPIQDFHCGQRAFTKTAFRRMELKTTGMEFASEMVIKASIANLKVAQVPITLHKDGRSRPPHLLPWRDGWRHLRFMLIYSPRWLFLLPGQVLGIGGGLAALLIYFLASSANLETLGGLIVSCACAIAGAQTIAIGFFTKVFGLGEGLLPENKAFTRIFSTFTLERGLILGLVLFLAGLLMMALSGVSFAVHSFDSFLFKLIAGSTLLVLSLQVIFSSFFMSILGLKTTTRRPPDPGAAAG